MGYTTYFFMIFILGGSLLLYYAVPKRFRWCILLAASYLFYSISSGWMAIFILLSTLSIFGAGLLLGRISESFSKAKALCPREERKILKRKAVRRKKWVVAGTIAVNFGILFFFKYFNFFASNVNHLLNHFPSVPGIPLLRLIMPLGISFYTLQAVSYVVDVYRGRCQPDRHLGRLALFVSFFPQIVEGPIGRYNDLAPQLYEGHSFDYRTFTFGLQLMLWGLFKKIVIADRANMLVQTVFSHDAKYSGTAILMAILVYTLQIYADFSGMMDMVSGMAQLYGIHLAENFRRPFFSRSVNEFWRRWHITLGAWLRDYIFYPVSLSKPFGKISKFFKKHCGDHLGQFLPAAMALFFVWFGNGVWHGASWKYIFYGLYYYAIMMAGLLFEPLIRKLQNRLHIRPDSRPYRCFQIFRTFLLVNIGMLIFRAPGLRTAFRMLTSVFSEFSLQAFTDGSLLQLGLDLYDYAVLLGGVVLLVAVGLLQEKGIRLRESVARRHIVLRWTIYFAAIFLVIIFGAYGDGYVPVEPLYAQF